MNNISITKLLLCCCVAAININAEPVQAVLFEGDYGGNRNSALGNAPDFHFEEEGDFNLDGSTDSRTFIPILFPYPGIGDDLGPKALDFQIDQDLFGVNGIFYTGAQIVSYSPESGFFPSFGLYRWGSGPQAIQLTSGNETPTDDMGFLGAMFVIKEDFLNGADEITDLKLPNETDAFSAEVFFRGKPKVEADPAGLRRARFIIRAGDTWYISETGTANDGEEIDRDQVRTLSTNPAADNWYEYDEEKMLFMEEQEGSTAPVGAGVRGDSLSDITAAGVIMQNTRFNGTIENHYVWLNWNEFSMHLDPDPEPLDETETWAGYELDAQGWTLTDNFMGWINAKRDPWIWSIGLNKYVYLPESHVKTSGAWMHVRKGSN